MLVVHAVDAVAVALAAKCAFPTVLASISFAESAFAKALASIFTLAFAWLGIFPSAFARALSCAMAFAFAIRANLGTRPLGHPRRREANTLRMSLAMTAIALQRRPWPCIFAFPFAFAESIYVSAILRRRVRGPRRGWVRPSWVGRGGCCIR